jgi:hypothetical protein
MPQDYLHMTHMSAAAIKRLSDHGHLQLRPPFQRNPVWLDAQKSYLIDTILQGFPVPELYMQIVSDADGMEKHIVVDGQQRLTALLDFISGEYSLSGLEGDWNESSFENLSTEEKQRVYAYNFVVRVLPDMPTEQIRAIFQRLNRNVVALSKQELRHATYWGDFIKSMEALATHEFWRSSGIFTANEVRRMHIHGPQNKKTSLDKWYSVYEVDYSDRLSVEAAFRSTLGEIEQMFPNISRSRWSKKSDFYTLFALLAERSSEHPFSREARETLSTQIDEFGLEVNRVLRLDPNEPASVIKSVYDYARAVQRAASDLGNRRARVRALAAYIAGERSTVDVGESAQNDAMDSTEPEDEYEEE